MGSPAVPVRLDRTEVFERAGVFFAGVDVSAEMLGLEQRVTAATSLCGFVADAAVSSACNAGAGEGRESRPKLRGLKQCGWQSSSLPLHCKEFVLYQVFLGAAGSRYEVRERFQLGI